MTRTMILKHASARFKSWVGAAHGRQEGPGRLVVWLLLSWVCSVQAETTADAATAEERLNVILISLDTVRPDHLSCYGYHRETTPHIDRIAREGVRYTQAFSQAAQTFASHLSIFTSRYPKRSWIFWEASALEPTTETLTEALHRFGYATAMFAALGHTRYVDSEVTGARAFRVFDEKHFFKFELKPLPPSVFEWLQAQRGQPFFLFLHGYDAHEPHVLPIRYDAKRFDSTYEGMVPSTLVELHALLAASRGIEDVDKIAWKQYLLERESVYRDVLEGPHGGQPKDLRHVVATYDAQLYYLDQALGQLFTALRNLELMDRTLLVLLSDHGQEFGEHGRYASHWGCYDEVTRMVLIVRDPRQRKRGRTVQQLVQAIDVMPTILELLGLPIPASAQGRSLVPLLRTGRDPDREAIAISVGQGMRAIRTPTWKLISPEGSPTELYRLRTDPTEQRNLITRHPDIAAQLQHRLDAVVSAEVAGAASDPEQWRREHGYW